MVSRCGFRAFRCGGSREGASRWMLHASGPVMGDGCQRLFFLGNWAKLSRMWWWSSCFSRRWRREMAKRNRENDAKPILDENYIPDLKVALDAIPEIDTSKIDFSIFDVPDIDFSAIDIAEISPEPEREPLRREDIPDDPAEGLLRLIKHYGVLRHRRAVAELQRLYDRPGDMPILGGHGRTGRRINPDMLQRFRELKDGRVHWDKTALTWRWLDHPKPES